MRFSNESIQAKLRGLYAITPDIEDTGVLLVKVKAALEGGARVVQYRNKSFKHKRLEHALGLSALCQKFGALFIVNDHLQLALNVDADGVHLGKTDGGADNGLSGLAAARRALDKSKRACLLGVSCYNDVALAAQAVNAGADYVAFGSVFASQTKPHAVTAPLTLFAAAKPLGVPLVAIGGITHANAAQVVAAGADAVAVISDLFDTADIAHRAQAFTSLFPS
jgi:thiamine-phosphate pyrophosphorylase